MRLPRRVPWSSIAEVDQVCAWMYADEQDNDSKILAINRLSAWRAITALPHAMESALAILSVIVEDKRNNKPSTYLWLRQSYASALTRLVNGLVDQLQLGAYARSIASIAHQLGLPQWLVELRHAATHEDLPSLELLREAAREAMGWLLHNYFIPTINPSSASAPQPPPLRPLNPILKQYKNILKLTTRDVSLKSQYRQDLGMILKDIERWISEAKVVANVSVAEYGWTSNGGGGGPVDTDFGERDAKDAWALDRLCDALLQKGTLVPLSKKKRTFPTDSFHPPQFSISLWSPLLFQLVDLHPDLPSILTNRICTYLVSPPSPSQSKNATTNPNEPEPSQADPTYDMCLARWAVWCIDTWKDIDNDDDEEDLLNKSDKLNQGAERGLKHDIVLALFRALGPSFTEPQKDLKPAQFLLQALCKGNEVFELALEALFSSSKALNTSLSSNTTGWTPGDMDVMSQRLETLHSSLDASSSNPRSASGSKPHPPIPASQRPAGPAGKEAKTGDEENDEDSDGDLQLPPGWKLLDSTNSLWRSCPIGVHIHAMP